MAKQNGPLGDAELKKLNTLLKSCAETAEYCKKCERCQLDVDIESQKNAEQAEIARKIKAEFFPSAK